MKSNSKAFSVLIPDAGSPLFLGVLYCLAQIKEITIYAMSNLRHCPIKYSRYVNHYSYYPDKGNYQEWVFNINKDVKKYNIDLIMPVGEDGIKIAIEHKTLFAYKERLCIMPLIKSFNVANNKSRLSEHMFNNNIICSKSMVVKTGSVLNDVFIDFPVIAKPVVGSGGGKGIYKFDSLDKCKVFFIKNKFDYDYLLEEYIEGYDLGCNVLCNNGDILAYTIQRGNLFLDVPFSPQIGLDFLYESKLFMEVEKLMKSLNWSGIANIDIRYDKNDREYKILEINPRFWYTLDASLSAGVNFPYLYCIHSLGLDFEKQEYKYIGYLNFRGLIERLKTSKLFVFNLRFICNNTELKYALKDPLLIAYRVFHRIRNGFWKWKDRLCI